MTVNDTRRVQNGPNAAAATAQRSSLARTALVAGGAAAGLMASALAGFGLVGLMFPNSGLPGTGGAPLTAAAYVPAPVTVTVMPATALARIEPTAPAPVPALPKDPRKAVQAVPASLTPTAPVGATTAPAPWEAEAFRMTLDETPWMRARAGDGPPDLAQAPGAGPEAVVDAAPQAGTFVATKSGTEEPPIGDIDMSGYGPRLAARTPDEAPREIPATPSEAFGPRIASLPPAMDAAPEVMSDAGPEDFAMLADEDAAARAGAGLFAEPETPAAATPERIARTNDAIPAIRPAHRPEGFAERVAAAVPPDVPAPVAAPSSAAPLTSIRPAPRPEIRLAAAAAPAPAPATAAPLPEVAAPTDVVEVSAKRGSGGFLSGGNANCGRNLARAMPSRRGGATGSAFFSGLTNVSGPDRDARAIAELARGNMPSFLRDLRPVTFRGQDGRGAQVEITICVTPDYLALGSDKDYVRVPLGLPAAARIAGAFDMTLPTPRMVDAIYAQANVKLSPAPMTPGAQMSTTSYFVTHNAMIEKQLQGRRGLVGGHKKDVVMASRMASAPGRVAIYGWHQRNGAPIQPVSTVHGANYADYSHGIRLVSKTAFLNGKAVSLDDLLASTRYAHLLNTGGPMPGPVIRVASN